VVRERLGWCACSVAAANGADERVPGLPAWWSAWRRQHISVEQIIGLIKPTEVAGLKISRL